MATGLNCSNCKHWRKIREEDYPIDEKHTWEGPHGECTLIDEWSHTDTDYTTMDGKRHFTPKAKSWLSVTPVYFDDGKMWDLLENQSKYWAESTLITKDSFYCNEHQLK